MKFLHLSPLIPSDSVSRPPSSTLRPRKRAERRLLHVHRFPRQCTRIGLASIGQAIDGPQLLGPACKFFRFVHQAIALLEQRPLLCFPDTPSRHLLRLCVALHSLLLAP